MSRTDKQIILLSTGFIATYLSVWIAGVYKQKLVNYFSVLNAVTAFILIGYWLQNELTIETHHFEFREFFVLSVEAIVIAVSVYQFAVCSTSNWIRIFQYVFFGLHLLALLLFLFFMLSFRMTKLF